MKIVKESNNTCVGDFFLRKLQSSSLQFFKKDSSIAFLLIFLFF